MKIKFLSVLIAVLTLTTISCSGNPESVNVNADGEGSKTENVESSKKDILDAESIKELKNKLVSRLDSRLEYSINKGAKDTTISVKDNYLKDFDTNVENMVKQAEVTIQTQGIGAFKKQLSENGKQYRGEIDRGTGSGDMDIVFMGEFKSSVNSIVGDYIVDYHMNN